MMRKQPKPTPWPTTRGGQPLSIVPPPHECPRAFIARQAILDRFGKTWAYQLLYRDGDVSSARYADAHSATATVLRTTLMDIGIDTIADDKAAFIELSPTMFYEDYSELLPKDRVILQLPMGIELDGAGRAAIKRLRQLGYRIALGKFTMASASSEIAALCDYVKVDVSASGTRELEECLTHLRRHRAKPIAHKVETARQYDECRRLGFGHFQGYYLSDPRVFKERRPPIDAQRVGDLLRVLSDPSSRVTEIEQAIYGDVTLLYRLLRYLNSAGFGFREKVASVRQAIVLLGLENLRRWAIVLAVAQGSDKPPELLRIALIRGRMCKNLTYHVGGSPDTFFMTGLFSVLDALLDRPMPEILETLPLAGEISSAILKHSGVSGKVLECVISYERGAWDAAALDDCEPAAIASAWFRAVEWTDALLAALH